VSNYKKQFDSDFKKCFMESMIETWGERCYDYEENCSTCQAWDNIDTLIGKLESDDNVYEYEGAEYT
jgi:hypothetical protein